MNATFSCRRLAVAPQRDVCPRDCRARTGSRAIKDPSVDLDRYRRHPGDCGSSEFQIAVLTARVKHLTPHMQRNRKDLATRRALVAILERRKKVMKYLYYQDKRKFVGLVKDLGIRNPLKGLDMILEDRPEDMVTPTEELEGIVGKKQGNQVEGPVSELEATEPTEEEAEAVAKLQGQESPDGL